MAERRKQRRAGTACSYCHCRKIRCDVQQRGVPCTTCIERDPGACVIRQRKNARADSRQGQTAAKGWQETPAPPAVLPQQDEFAFDRLNQSLDWSSPWATSTNVDFSNLTDLEEIFAFTNWASLPSVSQSIPAPANIYNAAVSPPTAVLSFDRIGLSWNHTNLNTSDHQFLQSQACFDMPPITTLRQIIRDYFQFVHPNLPIIDEYRFQSLWTEDNFRLDGFSFLVFRAMLFAAIHFLDADNLSIIGFASKRDARLAFYRRTKFLFDFDGERNAIANAQACLLLTYYSPSHNRLRVNAGWLLSAARFARIAKADTWYLAGDAIEARTLKRLWWGILFRDRYLSLGLRWAPQIELNPLFEDDVYFLNSEDFEHDLGSSRVHDYATQCRIVNIATSTCDLMSGLTSALQVLYGHETVAKRMNSVMQDPQHAIAQARQALDALQQWHERNIRVFPVPISLDDTQEAVCIFANLLFCYHASAAFALNFHCMLVHEIVPTARGIISLDACQESSITAIRDIDKRTQELAAARLTRYLPITVSALLALPLLLQAINVAAVRGTEGEAIETRKLDVFTRILQSQRQNFDGADFCIEILSNIVAYLQNDEKFIEWIAAWRDGTGAGNGREVQSSSSTPAHFAASDKPRNKVRLNWATLIRRQTRLYLRLLLHLDFALCNGSVPNEQDLPWELLRNSNTTQ